MRIRLLSIVVRAALAASLAAALFTPFLSPRVQATDVNLRMPRYFDATGFWVQGPFREYWESHGGLYIFGYPITGVFFDNGLYKQYFERAIFEYHPEHAGTPYEVLLQRLGAIRTERRLGEAPFQPLFAIPDQNCDFYAETGHRLCFGFRTYWTNNGGLPNFGYPISEEFDERNDPPPAGDGEVHTAQYFERARFEYHPEHAGTQYETLLGLLGTEYLTRNGAPAEALARQPKDLPPFDPTTGMHYGPPTGYGFNAFLRGDEQPDRADFNQRVFDLTKGAGFSWIHFQVPWHSIERERGAYDLLPLDRIVDQATANGVKLLVSVVGPSPAWTGANGIPADTAPFQETMRFLADRYRSRVQAWEIWNEQNLAANIGGTVDVAPYVNLLKAGYQGVKAGDGSAIVLFGALTPTGVDIPTLALDDAIYLERIYAYNNGEINNYFDALGAHPGSNDNSPDQSWPNNPGSNGWDDHASFYFRRIEDLRRIMWEHGDGHKQIWLTEFGWSTANQAAGYEYGAYISDQAQADYLVRAFEIARTEWPWMGVMFVWNLNYSVITAPEDEKHPWAVLYGDWSPRPSYEALQAMPK
jgi:hypothetical protein